MSSSIKKGAITDMANEINDLPLNAVVQGIKLANRKYIETLKAKEEMNKVQPNIEDNEPIISGNELRDEVNREINRGFIDDIEK